MGLLSRGRGARRVPVRVYERVTVTRLSWWFMNGLGDALPCFFSTREGVEAVLLVVAPCTGDGVERRWPRRWRWLEHRLRLCDYQACTDPATGKPYPGHPAVERCMVIPGRGDGCRIVYVADWDKLPEIRSGRASSGEKLGGETGDGEERGALQSTSS